MALKPGVVQGSVGHTWLAFFCHHALPKVRRTYLSGFHIPVKAVDEARTILIAANSTRPGKGRIARYSSLLIAGGWRHPRGK